VNQPAPLREFLSFPAIGGVSIVAIGLFLLLDASAADLLTLDVRAFETEPWRLLTSSLLHGQPVGAPRSGGGTIHLGFNLYWMWQLGTVVERALGHIKTITLILLLAIGSAALQYAFSGSGVGLSGVVYGFVGLLWLLDRRVPQLRGAMPKRKAQFFIGWFFLCIALTIAGTMPVANVAHGTGALLGVLCGGLLVFTPGKRLAAAISTAALLALGFVGGSILRPSINYSEGAWAESFNLGVRAAEAKDYELATLRFEEATRYPRSPAMAWYNLGWAHAHAGRLELSLDARERAVELEPGNPDYVSAMEYTRKLIAAGGVHPDASEPPGERPASPPEPAPPLDPVAGKQPTDEVPAAKPEDATD
jgi:membrane associated rhomboid family serine protease